MDSIGRHLLIDFWGCGSRADDELRVRNAMEEAVHAMGAVLLDLKVHCFVPQGLTAVAILAESHLALHSWPEYDCVAIDAFTCGHEVDPEAALDVLRSFLKPTKATCRTVLRGCPSSLPADAALTDCPK